jgi:hypothetical protein
MNRRDRRRQAAINRQNRFVADYVHHLSEVGPEALGKPGITHVVCYHDEKCPIYDGKRCTCDPMVKLFAEPRRT